MTTGGIKFEVTAGTTLDRLHERKIQPVNAIPTPFAAWNQICGEEGGNEGLAKSWVCVIGGVTGTGKSYLALNLAANAVLEGHLVGMINFEMTQMSVTTRYLSILTGRALEDPRLVSLTALTLRGDIAPPDSAAVIEYGPLSVPTSRDKSDISQVISSMSPVARTYEYALESTTCPSISVGEWFVKSSGTDPQTLLGIAGYPASTSLSS